MIERLQVRPNGRDIDVPDGLVHHWVGTVFVPKATTAEALRLLQDYDRHAERLRARGGADRACCRATATGSVSRCGSS